MPGGSKGKYRRWLEPDGLLLLQGWARQGLTDEDIAKKMGIARWTLYKWKKQYSDIGDALKKGKEVADIEVENALYKSATGFVGPDGKFYAPNMTAVIFWLKNRKPQEWRDRQRLSEVDDNYKEDSTMNQLIESLKKKAEERKKNADEKGEKK